MKAAILVFPGSNCDRDCFDVLSRCLGREVAFVWHKETSLKGFDLVIIPGGFSYGDYLRPGALARFSPIMGEVTALARAGGLVLGICNGFQILVECGLLPGVLTRNQGLKFICKNVDLRVEAVDTPFTSLLSPSQVIRMPIAHGDGSYWVDRKDLEDLHKHRQVVLRYCDAEGRTGPNVNPNGSVDHIAGVCNRDRNVLGMMPHPERRSEDILGGSDGRLIFESAIAALTGRPLV